MFSKEFYHHQKGSVKQFTDKPQRILDVERMLQNKPTYWEKEGVSKQFFRKSIIVKGPFFTSVGTDYRQWAFKKTIDKLIDDGFSVYLWSDLRLNKISSTCFLKDAEGDEPVINDDLILKEASQKFKLSSDNILILDYITSSEHHSCMTLPTKEVLLIEGRDKVFADYIDSLEAIKTIERVDILTNILLEPSLIDELNCSALKWLMIEDKVNSELFKKMLSSATGLEYLRLSLGTLNYALIKILNSSLLDLKQLKTCDLSFSQEMNDVYERLERLILPAELKLKRLVLRDCSLDNINWRDINLSELKELDLLSCRFDSSSLDELLSGLMIAKNIEKLNLKGLIFTKNTPKKAKPILIKSEVLTKDITRQWDQLTWLGATLATESFSHLSRLLLAAPNLEYLDLFCFFEQFVDESELQLEALNLPQLKILKVDNSNVTHIKIIERIIKAAPNLKSLEFTGYVTLNFFDWLKDSDLSHLESLVLSDHKGFDSVMRSNILWNLSDDNDDVPVNKLKQLRFEASKRYLKSPSLSNPTTIPEQFKYLEVFSLHIEFLETQTVLLLLSSIPNLRELNIFCYPSTRFSPELETLLSQIKTVNRIVEPESNATSSEWGLKTAKNMAPGYKKDNTVDADTTPDMNKSFDLKRIFFSTGPNNHPEVNRYRINMYHDVEEVAIPTQEAPFILRGAPTNTLGLIDAKQEDSPVFSLATPKHYYGKQSFELTHEWQPIASLTPYDTLTHYHVEPTVGIDIQYSAQDNLYFIRSTETNPTNESVTLDFLIQADLSHKPCLDEALQSVVKGFQAFRVGTLVLKQKKPTSRNYLDAILEQKVGACRHRALAFKCYMKAHHPETDVRIVSNECHMFVEIKQGGEWIMVDLGGYPAKLNVDDSANPKSKMSASSSIIQNIQHINAEVNEFQGGFNTWDMNTKSNDDSIRSFINGLLAGSKKQLIQLPKKASLSFVNTLQTQAIKDSHPVFYIHSPDDLVCSAPFIERTLNAGIIRKGPGGPLHHFLTRERDNSDKSPVLIINYTQFSAQDMVNFNSLLDTQRYADGTPLADELIVIGVIDRDQPGCYQGGDFYSRMDEIHRLPMNLLPNTTATIHPVSELADDSARSIINLYHSTAWKNRLLGSWTLRDGQLHYESGALVEALQKNLPIEIQNPPDPSDDGFNLFWQQLQLHMHARVNMPGFDLSSFPYDCPPVFYSEGYAWDSLLNEVSWLNEPDASFKVINSSLLNQFFNHYEYQKEALNLCEGLLSRNANKKLSLYVTHALERDEWAMLLNESKKHHVTLSIALAPNLSVPEYFKQNISIQSVCPITPEHDSTCVIYTSDRDLTLAQIKQEDDWVILDSSELTESDLIYKLEGKHVDDSANPERIKLVFNQKEQVLTTSLRENKTVLLTGQWPDELIESLAPLLFQRLTSPKSQCPGTLILITEQPMDFISSIVQKGSARADDQIKALRSEGATDDDLKYLQKADGSFLVDDGFVKHRTRLRFIKSNPNKPSNHAWYGLDNLPSLIKLETFNPDTSKNEAKAFQDNRIDQVNRALTQAPFVFLAGLTGVGKTSFVKQYCEHHQSVLFIGDHFDRFIEWATATQSGDKILFIDEANLSPRQWSEFEGLFHKSPSILINGTYYRLTKTHRVIFAGNPLSYGDDRILASLFARHGNAIVFEPLPTAFIYEEIIQPVFEGCSLTKNQRELIATEVLTVYQMIAGCSRDEVLISPREVQMMALLINEFLTSNPTADIKTVAQYYAQSVGRPLVPAAHLLAFDQQFPTLKLIKSPIIDKKISHSEFFITPSREVLRQQLHDLISLRNRRQSKAVLNDAQRYGGLGGLIIEGEPGIGKSDLVTQYLLSQGFKKASLQCELNHQEPVYYSIPVSMELNTKKQLVLKAFHEGAIVLIDEINSAPMMEQLLNSLLMGQTPEGDRPKRPGFTVIGTQNPIHMAGRTKPSNALARRMITAILPPYSRQELLGILRSKGMALKASEQLLQAYQNACIEAKTKGFSPAPNVRNLIKAAEHWIKTNIANPESSPNQVTLGALPPGPQLDQAVIDKIDKQISKLLGLYRQKVTDLGEKCIKDSNYISIARATESLYRRLIQKKADFAQDPTFETFQQFKDEACLLIDEAIEKNSFNQHRGLVYRTPIVRELIQSLISMVNLIKLIVLKPIHLVTDNKNPVFKEGLYHTFFKLPNTETYDKTQDLKEQIDLVVPCL